MVEECNGGGLIQLVGSQDTTNKLERLAQFT